MGTAPLWVPIVVAVLGLLGTGGGALITQRRSDRREATTWARERERELWGREEVLRTFEQRRDAYVDFYETLRDLARTAYDHGMGLSEPAELSFDWHSETSRKMQHLRIMVAARPARPAAPASRVLGRATWWPSGTTRYGRRAAGTAITSVRRTKSGGFTSHMNQRISPASLIEITWARHFICYSDDLGADLVPMTSPSDTE